MRRILIGIGSHGYRGQEVPWSAVFKLENQDHWSIIRSEYEENQGSWQQRCWSPKAQEPASLLSKGRRRWTTQLKKRERGHPSSTVLVYSRPNKLGNARPYEWRWIFSPCLLNQKLNSSGNALTDTLRNHVLPAIWASLSPVKLTHNIHHHI